MSPSAPIAAVVTCVHLAIVPLLILGFIRKAKARLQNRIGPPILQPFYDAAKLLRKGETVSETATWVFRAGPIVNLAALVAVGLMVPWLGLPAPIQGDLLLAVYLVALGKFAIGLAALDTGSAFGALGASREAAISVQAEPALVMGLAALAAHARSTSFPAMFTADSTAPMVTVVVPLVLAALCLAAIAELARMPIDDPTTHLELTMVHEALILENSGRNLLLVEYAAALKMTILFGLMSQVARMALPAMAPAAAYGISLAGLFCAGGVVALVESVCVKLRWRRVPNLLSFGLAGAALACLVVAMRG